MATFDGGPGMTACDFDVQLRILDSSGSLVLDLNDQSLGLSVETIAPPEDVTRRARVTSPRVSGDYTVAEAEDAGDLVAMVRVEGTSWGQCAARWQTVRTAYRAERSYFIETSIEGVTTRWSTEWPDSVQPGQLSSANLHLKEQTYSIRWHVQPNPTVTIV